MGPTGKDQGRAKFLLLTLERSERQEEKAGRYHATAKGALLGVQGTYRQVGRH